MGSFVDHCIEIIFRALPGINLQFVSTFTERPALSDATVRVINGPMSNYETHCLFCCVLGLHVTTVFHTIATFGRMVQLADTSDLGSDSCRFESCCAHQNCRQFARVMQLADIRDLKSWFCWFDPSYGHHATVMQFGRHASLKTKLLPVRVRPVVPF